MKFVVNRVKKLTQFDKLLYWCKLIALTGSAQVLVQVLTLFSGILIIRMLPQQEYAFYTLANTMLGTMTVLADGGISSGIMAEGGKVWRDKKALGVVLATGLDLRRKFAIGSLLFSTPILIYLLHDHGASFITCILICLALIPAFFAALSDTVYQVASKLHQDIRPLQRNQLIVASGRLLLSGLSLIIFPFTYIALLANGVPRAYGNFKLKRISEQFASGKEHPDPEVRKAISAVVKRVLPSSLYYCISGQLTLWLISFFGNTASLASFGALGRITTSFTVITTVFSTLFVPRFAKLVNSKTLLVKNFLVNQAMLFIISFAIVALISLFDTTILKMLGDNYLGLENELVLFSLSGCLGIISQSTNSLLASRGLVVPPVLFILTTLIVQVGAAFVFPVNEIKGVIFYGISTVLTIYIIRLLFFYHTLRKS